MMTDQQCAKEIARVIDLLRDAQVTLAEMERRGVPSELDGRLGTLIDDVDTAEESANEVADVLDRAADLD